MLTFRALAVPIAAVALAACSRAPAKPPFVPTHAGPHLELRETKVSFGTRFDDEEPSVSIQLRNSGGTPLRVERVDTNCGCIRVGDAPPSLAPGASAEVTFKLRLSGMSGPLSRVVGIHTDDPEALFAQVMVEGEVKPHLAIVPEKLELRPASLDARSALDVDITSTDDTPVGRVTAMTLTAGMSVAVTLEPDRARLHIDAAPFAEDFTGSFLLRRGKYERVLKVTGIAFCDVRLEPERLEAGVIRGAKDLEGRLVARPGLEWKVVSVTTRSEHLITEVKDGVLHVRIAETAPEGIFAEMVFVNLSGAKPDRVPVAVTAFVEK